MPISGQSLCPDIRRDGLETLHRRLADKDLDFQDMGSIVMEAQGGGRQPKSPFECAAEMRGVCKSCHMGCFSQ